MSQDFTGQEVLNQSAKDVFKQLAENPNLAIALSPDLAEHMGAFEEDAVNLKDLEDDIFLNQDGGLNHDNAE